VVYPTYTVSDLVGFSGRALDSYQNLDYVAEALVQSQLLFKLSTCLSDFPVDPDDASLARYAILSLAEQMVLDQRYAEVVASPFASESIGSYTYSKNTMRTKVLQGLPTGVTWFDLAVERLGVCENSGAVYTGSVQVFTEDLHLTKASDGEVRVVGPRDEDSLDAPFDVSTPSVYDPRL
jgi:hypothetical protein